MLRSRACLGDASPVATKAGRDGGGDALGEVLVERGAAEQQTNFLAITGGTGKYKEAGGQLKVVEVSETDARLTFKITD